MGASTVRRHLRSLAKKRLVEASARFGGIKGRRSNQYVFPAIEPTAQSERLLGAAHKTKRSNRTDLPPNSSRPTAQNGTLKGKLTKREQKGGAPAAPCGAGARKTAENIFGPRDKLGPADQAMFDNEVERITEANI